MISYEQIVSEMERQLQSARLTTDERKIRESFSAIRSLCEVALSSREGESIHPKMLSASNTKSSGQFERKLLAEEDANGGSIFDF